MFTLDLPVWLAELLARPDHSFVSVEERMDFVIGLARLNVRNGTGGPFAAAVFRLDDSSLVSAGVNLVVSRQCSVLHAEIVALILAQQKVGSYDLSSAGLRHELIASTEPCAMCMGAVGWSGVRSLVCGARGEDAQSIGFDEGEKPPDWETALKRRGISDQRDVRRQSAAAVLTEYRTSGGIIYNPGLQIG